MTPQIKFIYNKKTTSLDLRIKIYGIPAGVYRTGISMAEGSFDEEKQICGDVSVMQYMNYSKSTLEILYRPGYTPEQMWQAFLTTNGVLKTIGDAFNYYVDTMKIAKGTKDRLIDAKNKCEKSGILSTSIKDVTPALIRKFLNEQDLKDSTLHLLYTQLKTVVTKYVKDHNIDVKLNIDGIIKKPRRKSGDEEDNEYLSFDEVQALLALKIDDKVLDYVRDLFSIMCFTGLSVSDLIQFTPEKTISADGKWLIYKRNKTLRKGGKRCTVPMLPITRQLIYKHEWPTKFPIRTIQYNCNRLGKLLGKHMSPHTARHTFGGIMLYFGFSMESVREMMGHSSIAVTEQIYAKVSKQKIEREMATIPKSINEMFKTK